MINKKYLNLIRSRNNFRDNSFIYDVISKRIIDSIDLIKIPFTDILELGVNENKIYNFLKKRNPNVKITSLDLAYSNLIKSREDEFILGDIDYYNYKDNVYNLIFSNFFIHLSEDFEKLIKKIKNSLKPNGFFIASIPDLNNIYQLVNSMYETDLDLYNGAYQRVNPTKNIDYILSVLKNNNYDIPTINSDNITIEYNKFSNLLNDIQTTSLSYCYNDKKNFFEKKNYFNKLEMKYKKKYYKDNFLLDIKFNIISAWKK